jgi:hypothetical protein
MSPIIEKELKNWELQVISFPNYDQKSRQKLLDALKPDKPEVFMSDDEFFKKRSNMADPELTDTNQIISPFIEKEKYDRIRQSRMTYGKNEFSIDSQYIQTQDSAESLMNWIINKVMEPKKIVGANIFSIPTLQLGDIVTLDYKDSDGLDLVTADSTRFVIYNINYSRSQDGPSMTIYLSEV